MNAHQERLNLLLDYLKMNPNEFAASLGYKRTDRIYNVINGRNGISSSLAKDISEIHNINYRWILGEDCEMLLTDSDEQPKPEDDQSPEALMKELNHWKALAENQHEIMASLAKTVQKQQETIDRLLDEKFKEKIG